MKQFVRKIGNMKINLNETVTTSNKDISLEEIKDCFEQFKPLMRERLMEQAIKDLDCLKLEEQIRNYLEENTDLIKPEKHIEVYVHASDEQIKEGKMTVSLVALDDYGKEMIGKINKHE